MNRQGLLFRLGLNRVNLRKDAFLTSCVPLNSSTSFPLWIRLVTNNLNQVTNGDVIWRLSGVVMSHASSLPVLNRVYGEMSGLGWCHLGRVTSCCLSPCQDPTGHQLRQDQRPPTQVSLCSQIVVTWLILAGSTSDNNFHQTTN